MTEEERMHIESMDLMRLNDCAKSTRMGMVDQGFPMTMKKLEARGLVKAVGPGYQVTDLGLTVLDQYKKELKTI